MDFIYHVFSSNKTDLCKFNRYPVILSISTLRNFDASSKIFVIDRTPNFHDWKDYPKRLNFEVIKDNSKFIDGLSPIHNRIFDIKKWMHLFSDDITYCDSDVFWLEDFIPIIDVNKISMVCQKRNGYIYFNSGFFYFRKNTLGHCFFNIWEESLRNWKNQENIQEFLDKFYGKVNNISDESVMGYLHNEKNKHFVKKSFEPTLWSENNCRQVSKLVHILSKLSTDKINLAFSIREINRVLRNVLTIDDFEYFNQDYGCYGDCFLRDAFIKQL